MPRTEEAVRGHSLTVQQCPRPKWGSRMVRVRASCGLRQLNLGASAGWEVSSATKAQACAHDDQQSDRRRPLRFVIVADRTKIRLFRAMAADRTRHCRYRPLEVEARPAAGAAFGLFDRIPYAIEQGKFSAKQGI